MPTQDAVAGIIQNKIDLAIVILPIENKQLRIMKLCEEKLVAIFARGTTGVPPDEITPGFVASQRLLVEHTRSSAYPLVMGWLSGQRSSACKEPTPIGTVEALKTAVVSGLGMAIVPEIAVTKHKSDFIVRALQPPLRRTLALIEHRCKPNEPAQEKCATLCSVCDLLRGMSALADHASVSMAPLGAKCVTWLVLKRPRLTKHAPFWRAWCLVTIWGFSAERRVPVSSPA